MPGYTEKNIAGQQFGKPLALRRISPIGVNHMKWLFLCDCGNEVAIYKHSVTSGAIKSCIDCGHIRQALSITKHGMSHSKEYMKFSVAKDRCNNQNNARFKDYGGRGIKFLFNSFADFFAELGICPTGLTLDRIDNNGNYEHGNVRWATWEQQFSTRRPWNWKQKLAAGV